MFYKIYFTIILLFLASILYSADFSISDLTNNNAQTTIGDVEQSTTSIGNPVTITEETPETQTRITAFVDVNSALNFRETPGMDGRIITTLSPNTQLVIRGTQGNWTNVTIPDGRTGWVSSRYVGFREESIQRPEDTTVITPPSDDTPPETDETETNLTEETRTGTITASALNVRNGPGIENEKTGLLTNGSNVTIIGEQNGWYQVEYGNGQTGWVSGRYVSESNGSTNDTPGGNSDTGPGTNPDRNNVNLNVPVRRQGVPENTMNGIYFGGAWCGPTAAGMVGDYFGINKTTRQWAIDCNYNYGNFTERDPNRRVGTPIAGIRDGLQNAGLNAELRWSASMDWLKDSVASNKPVVVLVNTIWAGHYIVVKGFRDGKVIVNDPASGREREFSESYFMTMWNAKGRAGISVGNN